MFFLWSYGISKLLQYTVVFLTKKHDMLKVGLCELESTFLVHTKRLDTLYLLFFGPRVYHERPPYSLFS